MDILAEKAKDLVGIVSSTTDESREKMLVTEEETKNDKTGEKEKMVSDDDVNILSGPNDVDVAIRPDVRSNDVKIQICGLAVSFICNCFSREKQ